MSVPCRSGLGDRGGGGTLPLSARQNGEVQPPCGPEPVTGGPEPIDDEERRRRSEALAELIDLMRPAVQADGGDLVLGPFDVVTGVVEVSLRGACSTCAISSATLQGGVERILRDRLPWVTEVVGEVDEADDPLSSAAVGRGGYVPRL